MRFVALVIIILSLPVFMDWLRRSPMNRSYAMMAIGTGFFLSGVVQIEASFVTWPLWTGTARGITVSFIDTLALALILTRGRQNSSLPFLWVSAGYFLVVMLSLFFSRLPAASSFYLFQVLRCILLFAAVCLEVTSAVALRYLFRGLALGLIIQTAYVVWQKLGGTVQAHGTMVHQNTLGIMVEFAILPLVGAQLGGMRDKLLQLGIIAGLIIVAAGGSRATLAITVAAIVILMGLSLILGPTAAKKRLIGLAVFAGLVMTPIAVWTLQARFGTGAIIESDQSRLAMRRAARAMSYDHPFGVGANMYVAVANADGYSLRNGVAWGGNLRSVPVHDAYLLARSETGWLGQLMFFLLFAVPAITGIRHAFRYRTGMDGSIALASGVALIAVGLHSQYEFVVQAIGPQGLMFIDMGIIAGVVRQRRNSRRRQRSIPKTADPLVHHPA